jgi:two-component system sensor histidine kinase ChiS
MVDYFIGHHNRSDANLYYKCNMLLKTCFFTTLFSILYLIVSIAIEFKPGVFFMVLNIAGFCTIALLMKSTRTSIIVLGNLYVLVGSLGVVILIYYSGGVSSPVFPWLIATPVLGLLIAGRRSAIIWAGISLSCLITYVLMAMNGTVFPTLYNEDQRLIFILLSSSGVILIVFVIIMVFETNAREAQEELAHKHEEIVEKNEILTSQHEELTIVTEQLERMYKQRTNTFINLAHETKTPLTLINNHLERYIDRMEVNADLQIIKANIERLNSDIVNFFDIERFNKGLDLYDHSIASDFSAMLNDKIPLYKSLADKKKININHTIEQGIVVKAHPGALERITNNLIENAIKYTENEGDIYILLIMENSQVCFTVSDNGVGIPESLHHKVFEPYFQITNERKNFDGMGMGLPIVKKIVETLRGDVILASGRHTGTKLIVTLPRYIPEEGEVLQSLEKSRTLNLAYASAVAHDCVTDHNKPYLLIVEDNIDMLNFLVEMLKEKYNVYAAINGAEALKKLHSIAMLDLIVSDVMMPAMDGFDFYREITQLERYCHIPFIFLTAKATYSDKLSGLKLGAIDYIEKPFLITQLTHKIESVLSNLKKQRMAIVTNAYKAIMTVQSQADNHPGVGSTLPGFFEDNCRKYNLTIREIEVIALIAKGKSYKEISDSLSISDRTVHKHISNIFIKAGADNKVELLNKLQAL